MANEPGSHRPKHSSGPEGATGDVQGREAGQCSLWLFVTPEARFPQGLPSSSLSTAKTGLHLALWGRFSGLTRWVGHHIQMSVLRGLRSVLLASSPPVASGVQLGGDVWGLEDLGLQLPTCH